MSEAGALDLVDEVSPADRLAVLSGLQAYNTAETGWPPSRPLAVLVRGPDGGARGGLIGRTGYGWLTIELVFLPEDLRRGGLGARILREAEAEAIRRGCHSARVETTSYQARGFYEKAGFRVFGTLGRYPDGHECYWLSKALSADASG